MKVCLFCACMGTLSSTLPEAALREALPDVRLIAADRLCDAASCRKVLESLSEPLPPHARVVVAACSRGARGAQALACLKETFPLFAVDLADIREACAWPSAGADQRERVAQAAALIRMAFARLERSRAERVEPESADGALVIGGGPAGMAAASTLAGLGVPVTLAERRPAPGGMLNQLGRLFPRMENAADVKASLPLDGVELLAGSDVIAVRRENGAWLAEIRDAKGVTPRRFGAVIVAVGAQPVLPGGKFGSGSLKGVISQMELDTLLSAVERGAKTPDKLPSRAVFIQCVNARDDAAPYCSNVCCPTAVKNALRLKALSPDASVTVLNRQMVMPGVALEAMYRNAMREGVRFLHVDDMNDVRVEGDGTVQAVRLPASPDGATETLDADCVVCSTPLRPTPAAARLAESMGLRADGMGFLLGHEPAHPLESDGEGAFLCGSARWPAFVRQAEDQGRAAAVMAARYLRERRMPMDEIPEDGPAAFIREARCSGCGRCVDACPHGACHIAENRKSSVDAQLCRRCGSCAAVCPCGAAVLPGAPSPREIMAALGANPSPQRRLA
ncbi:FAD-dependent oxidoreductase [Mailhella sp.]|uniref:FAD-dependent oxidoreductase n=1 Tax=Mailhella sp. TaxID=1981029 RepID=UPI003AB697D7